VPSSGQAAARDRAHDAGAVRAFTNDDEARGLGNVTDRVGKGVHQLRAALLAMQTHRGHHQPLAATLDACAPSPLLQREPVGQHPDVRPIAERPLCLIRYVTTHGRERDATGCDGGHGGDHPEQHGLRAQDGMEGQDGREPERARRHGAHPADR
jgi:hypothetical protein